MNAFGHPDFAGHEKVHFIHEPRSGLRAILAIHSTALGPALGGCRVMAYADSGAALSDVLRLSRDMTRKTAIAGLPLGGGRGVIMADSLNDLDERAIACLAASLNELGGRYVAAEDVGMDLKGLSRLAQHSAYVTGAPGAHGHAGGDLSPYTVISLFHCIRQASAQHLQRDNLAGLRVAIQGLGRVGWRLAEMLHEAGAELLVADLDQDKVEAAVSRFQAQAVAPNDILHARVDVLAPCALGGIIHQENVSRLRCQVIAGGANNQLESANIGYAVNARGILFIPDYVANAGGVIRAGLDYLGGHSDADILQRSAAMADTLDEILSESRRTGSPPFRIAEQMAYRRVQAAMNATQTD